MLQKVNCCIILKPIYLHNLSCSFLLLQKLRSTTSVHPSHSHLHNLSCQLLTLKEIEKCHKYSPQCSHNTIPMLNIEGRPELKLMLGIKVGIHRPEVKM